MNLSAVYFKGDAGDYRCQLNVTDCGDYPTIRVFPCSELKHPNELINLSGSRSHLLLVGSDWIDLQAKVKGFVRRIKGLLVDYRRAQIPERQYFEF